MWNFNNVDRTVKELYDWQQSHGTAGSERYLLTNYTSTSSNTDFWSNYKSNHAYYDSYFARRYKSFRFYGQDVDDDNPVEDVYFDWQDAVYTFLMMNDKKYSELYKLQTINNLSPANDINITETKTGTKSTTGEYVSGERTDTSSDEIGHEASESVDSTKAYNSLDFIEVAKNNSTTDGRSDTSQTVKGEQTDTEDRDYNESHTITTTGSKVNPSENIEKFRDVWRDFSFYAMVFDDICKELLLV